MRTVSYSTANRSNKGILRPALRKLNGSVTIEQTAEPRGLDWHALESGDRPFRWSGPNPRPKILIPYTYPGEVRITLCIPAIAVAPLDNVRIEINGQPVDCEIRHDNGNATMTLRTHLTSSYSILTIYTPEMACPHERIGNGDIRRLGIALSDIAIEPMSSGTPRT